MNKNTISWGIRILISFLFLLSAVAKLYPSPYFAISTFEVKQLYPMGFSESFAPYFSRVLIGIEFALGFLLLQKNFLRTLIIPVTVLLLFIFVIHLSYESIVNGGDTGNCGCFGSLLPMTPIQAIAKNIIAIGLLIWLYIIMPKATEKGDNFWLLSTVTLGSILALFMLAPIQPVVANNNQSIDNNPVIDSLLSPAIDTTKTNFIVDTSKTNAKKVDEIKIEINEPEKHKSGFAQYFSDIDKGKKTLCFFVPGCDHCRDAAKELTDLKNKNKNAPEIKILFMNEEAELIPDFFKAAGAEYPYKIIEIIPFWKILGTGRTTPGVKYLWNGNDYKFYDGIEGNKFDIEDYKKWIEKPFSELK